MCYGGVCGGVSGWRVSPVRCAAASPPATVATRTARSSGGAAFRAPPGTPPFSRGQALGPGDSGQQYNLKAVGNHHRSGSISEVSSPEFQPSRREDLWARIELPWLKALANRRVQKIQITADIAFDWEC